IAMVPAWSEGLTVAYQQLAIAPLAGHGVPAGGAPFWPATPVVALACVQAAGPKTAGVVGQQRVGSKRVKGREARPRTGDEDISSCPERCAVASECPTECRDGGAIDTGRWLERRSALQSSPRPPASRRALAASDEALARGSSTAARAG